MVDDSTVPLKWKTTSLVSSSQKLSTSNSLASSDSTINPMFSGSGLIKADKSSIKVASPISLIT